MTRKAIFLDRDGTMNPDEKGYISSPDQFHLFPFTATAIKELKAMGYLVIVVSNQSGIARGKFSMDEVENVHTHMRNLLRQEGTDVDAVYFSPYYAGGTISPWNVEHPSRKPGLGMFIQARNDFGIDPHHSWMIGDKYQDMVFGKDAGMRTMLVRTGYGWSEFLTQRDSWKIQPDIIIPDVSFAPLILTQFQM